MDFLELFSSIPSVALAVGATFGIFVSLFRSNRLSKELEVEFDTSNADLERYRKALEELNSGRDGRSIPAETLERLEAAAKALVDGQESQTNKILTKYSAQGLAQSRISFYIALVFASLGFCILAAGVIATFAARSVDFSWFPIVSGGIVEAVAALFFAISTRTQKVMVQFFDKLRIDKRIEDALLIASKLEDLQLSQRLRILLAVQLADMKDPAELFQHIVGEQPPRT